MHGFHKGLEARVRKLEEAIPDPPPTAEEVAAADARRAELCRASLDGVPAERLDLNGEEEVVMYQYMLGVAAPVYRELIAAGVIDAETGRPLGGAAPDDQGDEEPRTRH